MKKEVLIMSLIWVFACLLIVPVVSASLSSNMDEVQSYVNQYKTGDITAPQLVVHIEYIKNKMYEELDKKGERAFTEAEVMAVFDKIGIDEDYFKRDWRFSQYEKKFSTDDFDVIFKAESFFRHDKEYYEKREEEVLNYYIINYELRAVGGVSADFSEEISDFISDLKVFIESNSKDTNEYVELRKRLNKIKQRLRKIRNQDTCVELMEDIGMNEHERDYPSGIRDFYYLIKEEIKENCWTNPQCEQVCEDIEKCDKFCPDCYDEEVCEEQCEMQEVCEGEENETVCEMQEVCEDVCEMQEVCPECEQNCWPEQECKDVCEDIEECKEDIAGEIKIKVNCRQEGANLRLEAFGSDGKFDYYRGLNEGEGGEWDCENEMQNLVKMRKVMQKDINQDFVEWYFEEYLPADYDKMINGADGFKYVLEILIRNEEQISGNLHCSETYQWPSGFEKINITYINDNTHVEVWEKNIAVEWDQTEYYTTLYKCSWIPSKELLKGLINYKLSETDVIGPSAKDIARIKQDAGQMELVNSLAESYGGSFDVKLELNQKGEELVLKYLQINPDIIIKIVDSIEAKPDISVKVDYDVLYDFISYVSYETQGDKIYGPHWVHVEGEGGPGKFFGIVGAVKRMWDKGITIKPRYALFKLLFNSPKLIKLIFGSTQLESANVGYYEGETVKIEGDITELRNG